LVHCLATNEALTRYSNAIAVIECTAVNKNTCPIVNPNCVYKIAGIKIATKLDPITLKSE
jgi:hypothetical protein